MKDEHYERAKSELAEAITQYQTLESDIAQMEREALAAWRNSNPLLYARKRSAEARMNDAAITLNNYAAYRRRLASKQSGVVGRRVVRTTKGGASIFGVIEIFDESKDKMPRYTYIWDGELVLRVFEKGTDKKTSEVYKLGQFTSDDLSTFDVSQLPSGWTFEPKATEGNQR